MNVSFGHPSDFLLETPDQLPKIQEGFRAHLLHRAKDPSSKGLTEEYARVLHDRYGQSWNDIGMTVVDARVYEFAMEIVRTHFAEASHAVPRETIMHCTPIQHFSDGRYDLIVPALQEMNAFPGARTRLYSHAISLIHCMAHREGVTQVAQQLKENGFITGEGCKNC